MKKGDYILRPEIVDEEMYYNTSLLSINTPYKIIQVLPNGLLVLENFLGLVHPNSVIKKERNMECPSPLPYNDDDHRFYLTEEEEKEMLETLPTMADHLYEDLVLRW